MRRRVMIASAAVIAGLLAPLATMAPAGAGTGVGCTGSDCSVSLGTWITYGGTAYFKGNPTGHAPVEETEPPCLWEPIGDQITGSQYVINFFDGTSPDPGSLFDTYQSFKQAKQLLAAKQPTGTWYLLPVNPNASQAAQAECLKLPLFYFAPTGTTPPLPHIPARILAEYAYNNMTLPSPQVTISGEGNDGNPSKGYVNFATYVWWGPLGLPNVTASLPGQSATVVAKPVKTVISVSPAGAGTTYTVCGPEGSKASQGSPPANGAGSPPDCGVLWTQPSAGATITVTVTWQVRYHAGNGPGFTGNLVPGDPAPTTAGTSGQITVQEIQSIGTGNGN
jgi:hypothetical protein